MDGNANLNGLSVITGFPFLWKLDGGHDTDEFSEIQSGGGGGKTQHLVEAIATDEWGHDCLPPQLCPSST